MAQREINSTVSSGEDPFLKETHEIATCFLELWLPEEEEEGRPRLPAKSPAEERSKRVEIRGAAAAGGPPVPLSVHEAAQIVRQQEEEEESRGSVEKVHTNLCMHMLAVSQVGGSVCVRECVYYSAVVDAGGKSSEGDWR